MSFFTELKRRNVFRVAAAYIVASWLLLQVTDVLVQLLGLPISAGRFVFLLLVLGFLPAMIFSWAYEITPDGLKKESELDRNAHDDRQAAARLNKVTILMLVAVAAIVVVDRLIPEQSAPSEGPSVTQSEFVLEAPSATVPAQTAAEPAAEEPQPAAAEIPEGPSLAVLPFINMSDDAQNEYFSDGISEELLNKLVRIEGLRVPSRTSSFTFKGSDRKVTDIGRDLQVRHVLEGSVRKAGNRIRVTAQLIEVGTDTHLWSEVYTRELDDIFAVQDEISQAIVDAMQLTLAGADRERLTLRPTDNVEAYTQYLLGRHLWNQRTPESLLEAASHLREAVTMDPGFDQAWAALADTYVLMPEYGAGSIAESIPLAREAAEKALEINPDSARALTARAYYRALHDWDFDGAYVDFERAIALEPNYATARQWYAETLAVTSHLDEAIRHLELAQSSDPLAPVLRHVSGYLLLHANRLEEAELQYNAALKLLPGFSYAIYNMAQVCALQGRYEEARRFIHEFADSQGLAAGPRLAVVDAMENPSLKPRALELLASDEKFGFMNDGVFGKAIEYALLGEYELALENLEFAFKTGDPLAIHMNWIHMYQPLHNNPRFQAMLREMNLLP